MLIPHMEGPNMVQVQFDGIWVQRFGFDGLGSTEFGFAGSTTARIKAGLVTALPASLLISFLAFPMVSSLAFQAFLCEDFDTGVRLLIADYTIDCDDATQYGPIYRLAWTAILA